MKKTPAVRPGSQLLIYATLIGLTMSNLTEGRYETVSLAALTGDLP
jgi:hypothetical protein